MSPRITFLIALAGVVLAGLPLPRLTRGGAVSEETPSMAAAPAETVYAQLRGSGELVRLELRHAGRVLLTVEEGLPWEGELDIPVQGGTVDIVVEAEWRGPGEQAVTLTLEPAGREASECTRWADAGAGNMHDVFTFVW